MRSRVFCATLALALATSLTRTTQGEVVEWFPNSASSLQFSGHVAGFGIERQIFKDFQTLYVIPAGQSGIISTEFNPFGNGQLKFNEVVTVLAAPENTRPAPGGGSGSAPANFGLSLQVPEGSGEASLRNVVFNITGAAPFTGSDSNGTVTHYNFDATKLNLSIISGTLDYSYRSASTPETSGSVSLVGLSGTTHFNGRFQFERSASFFDSKTRLQFAYDLDLPLSIRSPNDTRLLFSDTIDAQTPEPSSITLIVAALALLRPRRAVSR